VIRLILLLKGDIIKEYERPDWWVLVVVPEELLKEIAAAELDCDMFHRFILFAHSNDKVGDWN
jgi:hypothetical protein